MNILSQNLQALLDNRLRYLPPIVGEAINSVDWPSKLIEIGRHYGLHVDEMEDFQAVVMKSMIGLIPPASFENELIGALAVSPATADQIIARVNADIFEPVHAYVMKGEAAKPDALSETGIHVEPAATEIAPAPMPAEAMQPVASIQFGSDSAEPAAVVIDEKPAETVPVPVVAAETHAPEPVPAANAELADDNPFLAFLSK